MTHNPSCCHGARCWANTKAWRLLVGELFKCDKTVTKLKKSLLMNSAQWTPVTYSSFMGDLLHGAFFFSHNDPYSLPESLMSFCSSNDWERYSFLNVLHHLVQWKIPMSNYSNISTRKTEQEAVLTVQDNIQSMLGSFIIQWLSGELLCDIYFHCISHLNSLLL